MAWSLDARIPLLLLGTAEALAEALAGGGPTALLVEAPPGPMPNRAVAQVSFDASMPHSATCGCCGGRSPPATALDRLFQARTRAQCGWFDRVLALVETPAAAAELQAALREDAVTAARFRLVS
ncbi:MAG TPA: hypothetical protein VGC80_06150 [Acetobacteraceae bacterium]|jgi:hypothetical protein